MTKLSQLEILPDGTIQVRLWKPGSDEQHQGGYHRTSIPPGIDPMTQIDAVDAHLVSMGYPPLDDRSIILDAAKTFHTPKRITAYKEKVDAELRASGLPGKPVVPAADTRSPSTGNLVPEQIGGDKLQ